MTISVRPYQEQVLDKLRGLLKTMAPPRRAILQAETGSGKTVMAAFLIRAAYEKGNRCLFIARGRELVFQTSRTLDALGVPHGVLMRGRGLRDEPVHVCSKDTLVSWAIKRKVIEPPPAELVVLDECHASLARGWLKVIDCYRKSVVIGLTATPARADGKGLGSVYQGMVQAIPTSELIARGFLVPTRCYAPYVPNLKGVKRDHSGDYDRNDAARRLDKPTLVGDVVQHWKELAQDRLTVVYGCTVAHALHLRDEFLRAGIPTAHVDGETEVGERDDILGRLAEGKLRVVTNVGVLQQGVDIPPLSCAVLVRPTRSLVLYRQVAGRIKRPHPGKHDSVLIDHSGSVYLHGLPDDDLEWTLDEKMKCEEYNSKKKKERGVGDVAHCPNCHAIIRSKVCTFCGHVMQKRAQPKHNKSGKLVEVTNPEPPTAQERNRYWQYCLAVAFHKGKTASMAGMIYKKKFGDWPSEAQGLYNVPPPGKWSQPVSVLFPKFGDRSAL